jgi:hypothetical protein
MNFCCGTWVGRSIGVLAHQYWHNVCTNLEKSGVEYVLILFLSVCTLSISRGKKQKGPKFSSFQDMILERITWTVHNLE